MSDEIVTLMEFDQPTTAHLVHARLKVSGIRSIVVNDSLTNVVTYQRGIRGLVRVQVAAKDLTRARKSLGLPPLAVPSPEPTACPSCGSKEFKTRAFWPLLIMFGLLICWFAPNPGRRRWICRDCSHRW